MMISTQHIKSLTYEKLETTPMKASVPMIKFFKALMKNLEVTSNSNR